MPIRRGITRCSAILRLRVSRSTTIRRGSPKSSPACAPAGSICRTPCCLHRPIFLRRRWFSPMCFGCRGISGCDPPQSISSCCINGLAVAGGSSVFRSAQLRLQHNSRDHLSLRHHRPGRLHQSGTELLALGLRAQVRPAKAPDTGVQECSSAGRASVSKTEGRGFEPLHSCHVGASRMASHPALRDSERHRSTCRHGVFLRDAWRKTCVC